MVTDETRLRVKIQGEMKKRKYTKLRRRGREERRWNTQKGWCRGREDKGRKGKRKKGTKERREERGKKCGMR